MILVIVAVATCNVSLSRFMMLCLLVFEESKTMLRFALRVMACENLKFQSVRRREPGTVREADPGVARVRLPVLYSSHETHDVPYIPVCILGTGRETRGPTVGLVRGSVGQSLRSFLSSFGRTRP